MSQIAETIEESIAPAETGTPLNSAVSILVAVSATLMALTNIKDGNVVQAMAKAQAGAVDAWAHYQAKSLKQLIAQNARNELRIRLGAEPDLAAAARLQLEDLVSHYEGEVARLDAEKAEIKQRAEKHEEDYGQLNGRDDQFDMAEACFTVSIALCGVTALTRNGMLFVVSLAFSAMGASLAGAGFSGWGLRLDWLAKFLS